MGADDARDGGETSLRNQHLGCRPTRRRLRLPLQHSLEPTAEYIELLEELAAMSDTDQRVAAFYDVLLPGLRKRFVAYLDAVDTLLDAPTVRIIERILGDVDRILGECEELRAEVPAARPRDSEWVRAFRARDAGIDPIIAHRPRESSAASPM
jgi:hypothetical protein